MKKVNFWIVKGNPRYPIPGVEERCGDIEYFLKASRSSDWVTYHHVPPSCRKGDPVFFWSSGKLRSIVGLGKIRNPDIDGHVFEIDHLSDAFFPKEKQVGIQEIRNAFERELSEDEYNKALYIKPSVVATIYAVSPGQAAILVRLLHSKNPGNNHLKKWAGLLSPNLLVPNKSSHP